MIVASKPAPAACRSILGADILIVLGGLCLCASVVLALLQSPGQFPWDVAGGSGTVDDPYLIATCAQLQNMEKDPQAAYALPTDVDCSSSVWWNRTAGFFPVGYFGAGFAGSLDGRGHTIAQLSIARPHEDSIGLFSKLIAGAMVRNLRMQAHIVGHDDVGAIAGWSADALIDHVTVSGVVQGRKAVGGVVGVNQGDVRFATKHSMVQGMNSVGGIAGWNYQGHSIADVTADGDVHGQAQVGGVAGVSHGSAIDRCVVRGSVQGDDHTGGIAGWLVGAERSASVIADCQFHGTINNDADATLIGTDGGR